MAAALSKLLSMALPVITVRWSLGYLGQNVYGLWGAVTSFFALFAFADLGLGNGLQTILSRAYGEGDKVYQNKVIYNTYILLFLVSAVLISLFMLAYPFIDWAAIMNVRDVHTATIVGPVILAIVIPKLLAVPLSLVQRVQLAYQEGYNSHLWQCVASLLNCVCIYVICRWHMGKVLLISVSAVMPIVIFVLNSMVYYYANRSRWILSLDLFDKVVVKRILAIGFRFLILSILTTIGLSMDTFIVANTIGLSDAATYSILYKITAFISVACMMICTPLWSANGEAMARRDFAWIRKSTKRVTVISLLIAVVASTVLLLFSRQIFAMWLGRNLAYSSMCITGLCIMQVLLSGISASFMVLNAANVVVKQIVVFAIFTVLTITLKFWLAPIYGVDIVPWISVVCYAVVIVPLVLMWTRKVLSEQLLATNK